MTVEGTNVSSEAPAASPDYSSASLFSDESGSLPPEIAAPAAPNKSEQDLSRRLEFLSKKERELMAREKQYKQQMEKYKQYETSNSEYENLKQIAPTDPIALLEKYGWDMEKLTNHVMQRNDGLSFQEKQSLMERVEKTEKRFEQMEEEKRRVAREGTFNRYIGDLRETASKDPERWELVTDQNAYEMAFQAADQFYTQKGIMVEHEEVLDIVENYLDQQAQRGLKYKKVQNRIGKNGSGDTNAISQQNQSQQSYNEPKTLTNNFAQNAPSSGNKGLSPEESKARIAKMMGNSLWE